jgi:hypothetical protein
MTTNLEANATVQTVLQRDRRQIRTLIGLTVGLWILAALMIPGFYFPMAAMVLPKFEQMEKHAVEKRPELDAHMVAWHVAVSVKAASYAMVGFLTVFTLTSLLAAICTIMLVLTVRRVTLRQMSEQLAEISNQLRQFQRSP